MPIDLLVYILLGLFQALSACWGGIVSARTLPCGRERNLHIGGFATLFVVGMALVVWSGLRAYDGQKLNDKNQKQLQGDVTSLGGKLDKSLDSQLLMAGELKKSNDGWTALRTKVDFIVEHSKTPEQKAAATQIRNEIERSVPFTQAMEMQKIIDRLIARDQQRNKIDNWPYGAAGGDDGPKLHVWFLRYFPQAGALNGQDRFFLYYMITHNREVQNWTELEELSRKEFGNNALPIAIVGSNLEQLGFVERLFGRGAFFRLKEPYYTEFKSVPDANGAAPPGLP